MTNPDNAIGTNGAYGGRTSVEAFNDFLSFTSSGIVSGWQCIPAGGMTLNLGGVTGIRDVAIAKEPTGGRTTINNRSNEAVSVTIPTAPSTNFRIDLVVAYVQNPPQGASTITDNPDACGIIVVSGSVSPSPTEPTEANIRSAITADGGTGSTAYYVVLAKVALPARATTITSNYITEGDRAVIGNNSIAADSIKIDKLNLSSFGYGLQAVNTANLSQSNRTVATITGLPAGPYLFIFAGAIHDGTQQTGQRVVLAKFSISASEYSERVFMTKGVYWNDFCCVASAVVPENGSIELGLRVESGTMSASLNGGEFRAIRLLRD